MSQTLKKIVNQSLNQLPKAKIVNSISQLCTEAVNKSFQYNSQSENSLDNQELLRMQVKQLKRENAFLKGKIQELKRGKVQGKPHLYKKQSLNCLNILKNKLIDRKSSQQQNSLSFILKEIQNILKGLAAINKIQIGQQLWTIDQNNEEVNYEQELQWYRKQKQFKQKLNKKLQMISLQKEESRYGSLLQIFSEFYKTKTENDKRMKEKMQKYIQKTIQISKTLIEKACIKATQKSIKSSCIYSMKMGIDQNEAHNIQNTRNNSNVLTNHIQNIHESCMLTEHKDKRTNNGLFQKHQLSYSTIDPQKSITEIHYHY